MFSGAGADFQLKETLMPQAATAIAAAAAEAKITGLFRGPLRYTRSEFKNQARDARRPVCTPITRS
jgi:hypothetical protein